MRFLRDWYYRKQEERDKIAMTKIMLLGVELKYDHQEDYWWVVGRETPQILAAGTKEELAIKYLKELR